MKLNWSRFINSLHSWTVEEDASYSFRSKVRHTCDGKSSATNAYGQLYERIWNMSFSDFKEARELVRKHNQSNEYSKAKIWYEKRL